MNNCSDYLNQDFTLPCGAVLKNRIAKAAMTERLADHNNNATRALNHLYETWATSGTGLLISGNIMVDRRYKESGYNIVLEDERGMETLKNMVQAGTKANTHFWAQINHAGRQATIFSTFRPMAPSAIKLKKLMLFAKPKAMSTQEVKDVEFRFVRTAELCKRAGFTGVQFHAAHGYLLSQFLSPGTNQRIDEYGGSVENRSRLLIDIVRKTRKKLGSDFPISVKLNSADFQRGGFDEEDAMYVIKQLEDCTIDLLEVSGGTYENIVFLTDRYRKKSTLQREAYFLDFAKKLRRISQVPLMVTGGFRSYDFCESVLRENELDIIGFARPFLIDKDFPGTFISEAKGLVQDAGFKFALSNMRDFAEGAWYDYQIHRLAHGKQLNPGFSPYLAVVRLTWNEMKRGWFRMS